MRSSSPAWSSAGPAIMRSVWDMTIPNRSPLRDSSHASAWLGSGASDTSPRHDTSWMPAARGIRRGRGQQWGPCTWSERARAVGILQAGEGAAGAGAPRAPAPRALPGAARRGAPNPCSRSPAVVALATPPSSTQYASTQWPLATRSPASAAASAERPLPAGPTSTTRLVEMSCDGRARECRGVWAWGAPLARAGGQEGGESAAAAPARVGCAGRGAAVYGCWPAMLRA